MDLIISFVILLLQSHLYLCQTRNTLCNTNDYYQEREHDRFRDVPMRRQYVITSRNGRFDQYRDFPEPDSYINYPDHDYSIEVADEDNYYKKNYPYIVDNLNDHFQNTPSYFIQPKYPRKTKLQSTNVISTQGAKHFYHGHPKINYPHSERIIIITSPESRSRYWRGTGSNFDNYIERENHHLRETKIPLRGWKHDVLSRNPNNNINVNTNSNSNSDSDLQHMSEDTSLSTSEFIDDFIDRKSKVKKQRSPTDSVTLLEFRNNDRFNHRPTKSNDININTKEKSDYLSNRRLIDENNNVNVNVNSNSDDDNDDDRAMSPGVITKAHRDHKLLESNNRRNIDATISELRSDNDNNNV